MILGFKTKWPDGTPTYFKEKILANTRPEYLRDYVPKIHTFRVGNPIEGRWRDGMLMHMATGVRTKNYEQFNILEHVNKCEKNTVAGVQRGVIAKYGSDLIIHVGPADEGHWLTPAEMRLFAVNDGFNNLDELFKWFFPTGEDDTIVGSIIHFTNFRYQDTPSHAD